MRHAHQAGYRFAALAASAILAGSGLLTACGSARPGAAAPQQSQQNPGNPPASQSPPGTQGTGTGTGTGTTPAGGPQSSSRSAAKALAQKLLSQLIMPSGSSPAQVSSLPTLLHGPATPLPGTADESKLFSLPQPIMDDSKFLQAHVPAGMKLLAHGGSGGPAGSPSQTVSFAPTSLPRGIYQAEVLTVMVPQPGGKALLRADAQVIWFPPRSADEHLNPASYPTLTVAATIFGSSTAKNTTKVIHDPKVIARLASMLNNLPAAPPVRMSCPGVTASYRLSFTPANGDVDTTVLAASCLSEQISVAGKAQPPLWDATGALTAAIKGILHLGTSGNPGS
jgi:hypothetical protein